LLADRYGHEILDEANDVDDDHDSDYDPDEESKQSSVSSGSYASSTSSGSEDDDDDDGNNGQVLPQQTAGVGAPPASENNDDSEGEDDDDSEDDSDKDPPDMFYPYSSDDESDSDDECPPSTQHSRRVTINVPNKVVSPPKANVDTSTGVDAATSAGVDMSAIRPRRSAGVGRTSSSKNRAELVPNMKRVKDEEEDTAHEDNDVESEMNTENAIAMDSDPASHAAMHTDMVPNHLKKPWQPSMNQWESCSSLSR
jgi:hypothetical protein